ncbi:hypothetical protein BC2230_60422 [Burkholderia cepacia]
MGCDTGHASFDCDCWLASVANNPPTPPAGLHSTIRLPPCCSKVPRPAPSQFSMEPFYMPLKNNSTYEWREFVLGYTGLTLNVRLVVRPLAGEWNGTRSVCCVLPGQHGASGCVRFGSRRAA